MTVGPAQDLPCPVDNWFVDHGAAKRRDPGARGLLPTIQNRSGPRDFLLRRREDDVHHSHLARSTHSAPVMPIALAREADDRKASGFR